MGCGGVRFVPKAQAPQAFAGFMALAMSCLMSALITFINVGAAAFPNPWLKNWLVAFVIAFPTVLLLAPLGQKLIARITVE